MLSTKPIRFSVRAWIRESPVLICRHRILRLTTFPLPDLNLLIVIGLLLINEAKSSAAPAPTPIRPFHLVGHVEYVSEIAFSPNGRLLAVLGSSNAEGRLMIFDYPEGRLRRIMKIPDEHLVGTLAFSPDGKRIAVACYYTVQVWNVAEGRLMMNDEKEHSGRVHSVHFCRDGKTLITAGRDNEVKVWNISEGKLCANFRLPLGIGSERVADGEPGIKPRPRPPLFVELKVPSGCLCSMVLLLDDKTAAVAIDSKRVYLWDVTTGKMRRSLKTDHRTNELALSSDGRILATGGDGSVRLWNMEDRSNRRMVFSKHNTTSTLRIQFSVDGRFLMWRGVVAKGEGAVTVEDLRTGEERFTIIGKTDQEGIQCCTLSRDGKLVAVFGGFDKPPRLRFWDLTTGKELPLMRK